MDDKAIAEQCTILRAPMGSTMYGVNLTDAGDRDEMGVCIESQQSFGGFHPFEQYEYRTARERTGKHDAKSGPGDLDLTIYGLRKFLRLALHGNPTVISLLFAPGSQCTVLTSVGSQLKELAPMVISRQCGKRFLGYLEAQRSKLVGERGQMRVTRTDLIEAYGFDTKYCYEMLRLGYHGIELLETGRITMPFAEDVRQHILDVRRGKVSMQAVLTEVGELERQLKDLLTTSPLDEHPNEAAVEQWMLDRYWHHWASSQPRFWDIVEERRAAREAV